jgi:hypothetical protein
MKKYERNDRSLNDDKDLEIEEEEVEDDTLGLFDEGASGDEFDNEDMDEELLELPPLENNKPKGNKKRHAKGQIKSGKKNVTRRIKKKRRN